MIAFRQVPHGSPFLWSSAGQPPGRWHGTDEGPVHYLADTPDGAWAEFLRQEDITEEADLAGIRRDLWAIELSDDEATTKPRLPLATMTGGLDSCARCRAAARRLRARAATRLLAPSAALADGDAAGWHTQAGLVRAASRRGMVHVLFGDRPNLVAWLAAPAAHPPRHVLTATRPLT